MVRWGEAPFLECSSKGDKRFSAFYARIKGRHNRTIEDIYQASKRFSDGSTGLSIKQAKGRQPINADEVAALYSDLWNEYVSENPELISILTSATGLSDIFGQSGHMCQATELWRIRSAFLE
jgi:hypothetical protein